MSEVEGPRAVQVFNVLPKSELRAAETALEAEIAPKYEKGSTSCIVPVLPLLKPCWPWAEPIREVIARHWPALQAAAYEAEARAASPEAWHFNRGPLARRLAAGDRHKIRVAHADWYGRGLAGALKVLWYGGRFQGGELAVWPAAAVHEDTTKTEWSEAVLAMRGEPAEVFPVRRNSLIAWCDTHRLHRVLPVQSGVRWALGYSFRYRAL